MGSHEVYSQIILHIGLYIRQHPPCHLLLEERASLKWLVLVNNSPAVVVSTPSTKHPGYSQSQIAFSDDLRHWLLRQGI